MLPRPKNQIQEVLHYLITKKYASRRTLMLDINCWNAPEAIRKLRDKGVLIRTETIYGVNRFGREISWGIYSLTNEERAREIYFKLIKNEK